MAIAKGSNIVAPSNDIKTKAELDSLTVEAGIYHVSESVTINGVTSSKWTVICLSDEKQSSLRCYTQIWASVINGKLPRLFTRSAVGNASSYSAFSSYVNCPTTGAVDLYIGGSQPSAESGITKVYIEL